MPSFGVLPIGTTANVSPSFGALPIEMIARCRLKSNEDVCAHTGSGALPIYWHLQAWPRIARDFLGLRSHTFARFVRTWPEILLFKVHPVD